jgi:Domain of unknown function (DUF1906)
MRRAVVAVIMCGFMFWGFGPGLVHQPVVFGASLTADVRAAINKASLTAVMGPVKETTVKQPTVKETTAKAAVERAGQAAGNTGTAASTSADKTITYKGVQFRVPASWPVYWLDQDPNQCVRYDMNAVYVGTPGPNQDCPAGLIGRADTITIGDPGAPQGQGPAIQVTPATQVTPAVGATPTQTEQRAMLYGQPATGTRATGTASSGTRTSGASVAPGTIFQNPDTHEFAVAMPSSSPWINATYGSDPGAVVQSLATVRQISAQSAALGDMRPSASVKRSIPKPTDPAWPKHVAAPTGFAATWIWPSETTPPKTTTGPNTTATPTPKVTTTPTPKVTTTPTPKVTTTPTPKVTTTPTPKVTTTTAPKVVGTTGRVLAGNPALATTTTAQAPVAPIPTTLPASARAGFDTCTAPSLSTMKAWKAKYSATAIYIGGQMVACDAGNLSASWVQQTEAMGWSLLPTFVGLQAPCNSFSGKINPKQAAAQGTAAANQAIGNAQSYGLNAGSPIYYDMEGYDHTNASCRTAVLTFLDAWDRQLQAKGYVSGVYSSADAAVIDLQTSTTIAGHALDEPQAVWFALWDNVNNLTGSPYMNSSVWPVAKRSKQFAGNKSVKVGGITLNIDADWVNGPAAK